MEDREQYFDVFHRTLHLISKNMKNRLYLKFFSAILLIAPLLLNAQLTPGVFKKRLVTLVQVRPGLR